MCVLECLRRLKTSTRVKDIFLFKSCSFVNACVKEDDFFVRNISSEFYCRMIVICMFNEVVNLLFISVPQGKHIIDKRVSLPYQRFCISLLCTGLFVLWGGWGERKRKRAGHNGKGKRERRPLPIVLQPGASAFCNRASELCSLLASRASEVFWEIQITAEL